ncbi:GIY-YIG nuclease family protein [Sphingomonas sp. PL-96]|uniref:TrmH family RNA methyltransferase n=1 Tax=Sphingomonas sp. PL-96 TaxID=2887201 RepID=UPI001E5BBC5D|nr:TrmH family RNA methyltransferase [Sphingomonas sp. PL-96]MCC2977485.1 GIY-YIG nuclease family protein [Sphingomonas sp. PL-96]
MSFQAYLLRCADGSYYAGHTDDLDRRMAQHQSGTLRGYTAERRPVTLVWSETFDSREEAVAAEIRLKGWSRAKKEALIAGDWDRVQASARKSFDTGLRQAQPLLRTNGTMNEAPDPSSLPTLSPPPVIVLVRPQLGENIGKAARAMLNFGLVEMRLVSPRDGWPNPQAGPAASGADVVLEKAQVFETVADAVADCTHVFATTVRKRGVTKPVVTPEEAARAIRSDAGRAAILFGPERSGLETDDVALARTIVTVPINPEFGSLNLAQAVILVAYEWSKGADLASPPETELDPPAPQEELEGMITQLDGMLEEGGYFFPPDRVPTTRRMLRTLLTKPGWNAQEVRTVRGILSTLARPRQR